MYFISLQLIKLSMLCKNFSRQHFEIFFKFSPENRLWHFMQIVSLEDFAHHLWKPIFWENWEIYLTLKVPSKICSRWHSIFFFYFYFSEKTSLDILCESIHMKCQDLFSLKNKKKKKKMSSAAVVIGTLRVNILSTTEFAQIGTSSRWGW